jgi:leucyl aminopeptidase
MAEVVELRQKNINFIDITNFQNSITTVPVPPALPNQPQQKPLVYQLNNELSITNMRSNLEILTSYKTRYFSTQTGVQAAQWIQSTLIALSSQRTDVTVSLFTSPDTDPQPSVIARIQGTQSDDLVIIGCHEDSIHLGGVGVAPGADDDGSGVVSLLEIFRVLISNNFQPNRTVEFHFYAAEEVGLLGSQAVAQNYASQNKVVVGMLQLDMTSYIGKNGQDVIGIVTDFTNSDENQFIRELVDVYSLIPWVNTQCGYGCSDHASWTYAGYRASFPFESEFSQRNPYIHTAEDTLANVDWAHALNFAKIGLGFVVEVAATNYLS